MKKIISIVLCVAMLMSLCVTSYADFNAKKLTQDEWNLLYNLHKDDTDLPTLNVGANAGEVRLCWHIDAPEGEFEAKEYAKVRVAENFAMADAKTFIGELDDAETEEQAVCRVTVDGLKEKTTYYYQWYTGDSWSKICKYETKSFTDHKALVIGDIQIGGQTDSPEKQSQDGFTWNNVLSEALIANPDISYLVSPGDNTSTGKGASEWQTFLMPEALRGLPIALAIGNHDKKGMMYHYYTSMPNEFYGRYFEGLDRDFWFRYGDVLYLFFDATSACAADHMAMAKEAVEKNPDAKWRIGVMHQALFGPGYSVLSAETMILLNAVFTPIFDSYDIDLVLTGHSHLQGRSHFMYESMMVGRAESGKTYKNPMGTVYINNNAICDQGSFADATPYIAYAFEENDVTTYTTLEFKGDTMTVETRRGDNSELLDSFAIEKTSNEHHDDMPHKIIHRFAYKFVEFVGRIYQIIDTAKKS